jgi:2-dehydro-3-deoxygluconokinase
MTTAFDVLTFGETMVLLAPTEGTGLETSGSYHASIGGAESNCSIGLARLGHSVCWVSRLGLDPFGNRVLKTIRGEGVDTSRVERCHSAPTGLMFKEPGAGNTTRVFYYRRHSAASVLRAEQFDSLRAKYLLVTGITPALSETNRKLTLALVQRFREEGAKVVFDPNMRFKLWSAAEARPVFVDLARNSDLLLPSVAEAEILTRQSETEALLDELLQMGPAQVVIKAGEQGAWYADRSHRGFLPSYPAVEIDPVGAGDAFCAGLISGLLDGLSLPEAVSRAGALGAFCVSSFGDYSGLPDRVQLEAFMERKVAQGR